ncbi:DUF3558 family protein [Amycolatopsis magusensis]|uniref:DUF3558 family protein n=1 Tax=Amycolatopsis magusensis TaxID=882444 RepID=UPI003C306460
MARSLISLASVASVLLLLSACSPEQQGRPQVVQNPTVGSSSEAIPSPQGLGEMNACSVLDKALADKEFPAGEDSDIGSNNGCRSVKVGITTSLDLDDQQGVDDVRADPSKIYEGKIHGRRILQVKEGDGDEGMCQVLLEVASKARAMVTVTVGSKGNTDQACDDAFSIAQAVEPQLPKA